MGTQSVTEDGITSGRQGYGVIGSTTIDLGAQQNAVATQRKNIENKITAQNKEIAKMNEFTSQAWDKYQSGTDESLTKYRQDYAKRLKTGDGALSYKDQRELEDQRQAIVSRTDSSLTAKAGYDAFVKDVEGESKREGGLINREASYANMDKAMYQTDDNGEFILDKNNERIMREDIDNINFENLKEYNEVQEEEEEKEETLYNNVVRVKKSHKTSIENDRITTGTKNEEYDVIESVGNFLKNTSKKGYNNLLKTDEIARSKGYENWEDWKAKDDKEAYNYMFDNHTLATNLSTGYTRSEDEAPSGGLTIGGGYSSAKFVAGTPNPVTTNTKTYKKIKNANGDEVWVIDKRSNIHATNSIPLAGKPIKIQLSSNDGFLNLSTGKWGDDRSGLTDMTVSRVDIMPSIRKEYIDELEALHGKFKSGKSKFPDLIKTLKKIRNGEAVAFSKEDNDYLKKLLKGDYDKYIKQEAFLVGTGTDRYSDNDYQGKTVKADFAIPLDVSSKEAFNTELLSQGMPQEQINNLYRNIGNQYGGAANSNSTDDLSILND